MKEEKKPHCNHSILDDAKMLLFTDLDNSLESDHTVESEVGNIDVEGWRLVQLKGKPREIRVITENTPNLHLYKQTHIVIDRNDFMV